MTAYILAVSLLVVAVLALLIGNAYFYVPYKEMKRRAAHGNRLARVLYRAAAYNSELKLLVWSVVVLSSAGGFVLFSRIAPPLIEFVITLAVLVLAYLWLPRMRPTRLGVQLAKLLTPAMVKSLRVLHPILKKGVQVTERLVGTVHTGLFERDDMYELIEWQGRQQDNRLTEQELTRMQSALRLGELKVRDILIPRKNVKAVEVNEELSPVLLDELYSSGHTFFPVYEDKMTDIVGLLSLDSVANLRREGRVHDHVTSRLAFIHEADTLEQALRTFGESRQQLLIVVNNLNEYVGIITLSDVTHWLLSESDSSATSHEDREIVAARHGRTRPQDRESTQGNSSQVVQ